MSAVGELFSAMKANEERSFGDVALTGIGVLGGANSSWSEKPEKRNEPDGWELG